MDTMLLLLLVPAVAVPAVLLWGFAGCQLVFPLNAPADMLPPAVSADGISTSSIRVSWVNPNPVTTTFRVERVKQGDLEIVVTETSDLAIEQGGLEEGTTYFFSVFAINVDSDDESEPGTDEGTTLGFTRAFETNLNVSQPDLQGFCIIQRLEPLSLDASGGVVRITLHGSALGPLTLDKITISRALTPPTGNAFDNLYDAAETPIEVASSVVVPQDAIVTLPPITYTLDRLQPLLIAFNLNPTAGQGNVRRRAGVQSDEASMFFKAASADADVPDRVPTPANPNEVYNPSDSIYIVEKIEVVPNG